MLKCVLNVPNRLALICNLQSTIALRAAQLRNHCLAFERNLHAWNQVAEEQTMRVGHINRGLLPTNRICTTLSDRWMADFLDERPVRQLQIDRSLNTGR